MSLKTLQYTRVVALRSIKSPTVPLTPLPSLPPLTLTLLLVPPVKMGSTYRKMDTSAQNAKLNQPTVKHTTPLKTNAPLAILDII